MKSVPDIILIGCGASGALLSTQLFRTAERAIQLVCVEPRSRLGAGLAYSTHRDEHRLNVPANRMSALPGQPDHFVDWLTRRRLLEGPPSGFFARRRDYADYLTDSMGAALRESRHHHGLHHEPHWAVGLRPLHGGWLVQLDDGSEQWSRQVVLALGNLPPSEPLRGLRPIVAEPGYIHDPWDSALSMPDRESSVAIIGSGLTAIDQIMTLDALDHRGAIHAFSRHGFWSGAHVGAAPPPEVSLPASSPARLSRTFRQALKAHQAVGGHWQHAIDALRPVTAELWSAFSESEKRQFCRHLQSYWNRARHRMAPEIAERIATMTLSGQLSLRRAPRLQAEAYQGRIRIRPDLNAEPVLVDHLINCTGASVRVDTSRSPLLTSALESGLLRSGPVGLGLANDELGQVLAADGLPHAGLYTIGPMRQGSLWESTAIPEIRVQAERLAEQLLRRV